MGPKLLQNSSWGKLRPNPRGGGEHPDRQQQPLLSLRIQGWSSLLHCCHSHCILPASERLMSFLSLCTWMLQRSWQWKACVFDTFGESHRTWAVTLVHQASHDLYLDWTPACIWFVVILFITDHVCFPIRAQVRSQETGKYGKVSNALGHGVDIRVSLIFSSGYHWYSVLGIVDTWILVSGYHWY